VTTATVARTGLSSAPNFGSENLLKWLVETCERPRSRAAEQRDELSPPHLTHVKSLHLQQLLYRPVIRQLW
jgi:hypothetical protein